MSEDFEQAEKTLVALRSKRDAVVAHGVGLGEERGKISFAAHTGDAAARKRLDKLNAEIALHDSELRSLDAAIAEATERVKQAQAAEHAKAERETAAELKAAVADLRVAGQTLDDALAVLVGAGGELHAAVDKIHALGCSHPHHQQVLSLGERALVTAL
jgi:multidrug resistance efflux pump